MDQNNYEESIKKEFESSENQQSSEQQNSEKTTNLGKVDVVRGTSGQLSPDDPEIKRLNDLSGYVNLKLENLPSGGRFYRDDFEIHIRAARVGEIRNFSTIDEENIKDIDDNLNAILVSCIKVVYGSQRGSYRDILEEDRIYVILSIKELTFKDGENKLLLPVNKKNCPTGSCKAQESVELKTENLQFNEVDELVEKYYDTTIKAYRIATKNYGEVVLAPPNIGVMRAITDWARKREDENKSWDKSSVAILPYLQREWRGFNEREIFSAITSMQGWEASKYSLIYRLIEKIKVGVKPEFTYSCVSCGAEVTAPLTFPGGIKSLFIISDISDELL